MCWLQSYGKRRPPSSSCEALKPGVHHSPIQLLPIRHPQHSRGVEPAQVTAQLVGGGPRKLRVGRIFAQQYGFVLDQVLGHPVTKIGLNGIADQVERSQGGLLISFFLVVLSVHLSARRATIALGNSDHYQTQLLLCQ